MGRETNDTRVLIWKGRGIDRDGSRRARERERALARYESLPLLRIITCTADSVCLLTWETEDTTIGPQQTLFDVHSLGDGGRSFKTEVSIQSLQSKKHWKCDPTFSELADRNEISRRVDQQLTAKSPMWEGKRGKDFTFWTRDWHLHLRVIEDHCELNARYSLTWSEPLNLKGS